MAFPSLPEIHADHVALLRSPLRADPESRAHDVPAFHPVLVALCEGPEGQAIEFRMSDTTPALLLAGACARVSAAIRDGGRLVAVTSALEAWMTLKADDGAAHPDWREVFVVATAGVGGATLTTARAIERAEGGDVRLGETLVLAERGREVALAAAIFAACGIRGRGFNTN